MSSINPPPKRNRHFLSRLVSPINFLNVRYDINPLDGRMHPEIPESHATASNSHSVTFARIILKFKIRSMSLFSFKDRETNSKSQIQMTENCIVTSFEHSGFVLWICFGFRISNLNDKTAQLNFRATPCLPYRNRNPRTIHGGFLCG